MSPLLLLGAAAAAVYLVTRSSSSQSYVKVEGGMQLFDDSKLVEGAAANNFSEAMPHYRPKSAPTFADGAYTGAMVQTMVYGAIPSSADTAKHKKVMTDALETLRSTSGSDELFLCIKISDFNAILAGSPPEALILYYAPKAVARSICAPGAEYAAVPLAPV